jgi:Rrf2 family transcriptional regulator, cysteine metabolism repressor
MKISTKGRYGMRAMVDLAIHNGETPVLLKDIAKRQQLSERYLEQLVLSLKAAGLVKSIRGAHGGFMLAKAPGEIRLSEIFQVLEGPLGLVECVDDPASCSRVDSCVTRDIWQELKDGIVSILDSKTLQDLAEQQDKKDKKQMYYI